MIKAICFDLDGTLADTKTDLFLAINHCLLKQGAEALNEEQVYAAVGNGARLLIRKCMLAAKKPIHSPEQENRILEQFKSYYQLNCTQNTMLYPGVAKTLSDLEPFTLAVLTNKPKAPTKTILTELGISTKFSIIIGGDENLAKKPDPAGLHHIAMNSGIPIENWLMVGDGIQDREAARNAGCKFLGWEAGIGNPWETSQPEPPMENSFNHFSEIMDKISLWNSFVAESGNKHE